MVKYRSEPKSDTKFTIIDNHDNTINASGNYYMFNCPTCCAKNLPHAISSGKCYRCGYELTYKDEINDIATLR